MSVYDSQSFDYQRLEHHKDLASLARDVLEQIANLGCFHTIVFRLRETKYPYVWTPEEVVDDEVLESCAKAKQVEQQLDYLIAEELSSRSAEMENRALSLKSFSSLELDTSADQVFLAMPIILCESLMGSLVCFGTLPADDLVQELEEFVLRVSQLSIFSGTEKSKDEPYKRLIDNSDAIFFTADETFRVSFISERALDFFGISPEDFIASKHISLTDLVHPDDQRQVYSLLSEMRKRRRSFEEEFRVVNRVTGKVRWLLTRFVPIRGEKGAELHWDGFGFDISARKEAQEALATQSKKIRALYTVSSAIRGFLDPANVAHRGLGALSDATEADAGLCYLFDIHKPDILKLIAHTGFSPEFPSRVERMAELPSLSRFVATHGQAMVVPDLRADPRASKLLSENEAMRSAVLVPISVEDRTIGTLGLFSSKTGHFEGGDVMLIGAAANQIGLAARQARLFEAFKRQTKILTALYRVSHELSRNLSLEEIFQNAFGIIQEELGLRRLWLGLLNETATRVIGQAAYGPGWRKKLVEVNVEISGSAHPLARVVKKRSPIVIENPEEVLKELGVKRIVSRLGISSLVLVPLISSGQVLGVLAVQPGVSEDALSEEELGILTSLANEIASIVFMKRLEERMAESEKMRTVGLLAAGVAHNFNNLLQAILGQASLIEMQSTEPERIAKATQTIQDAATKGAGLVRQLLSFAQLEEPKLEACNVNEAIEKELRGINGQEPKGQSLKLNLAKELPSAQFDRTQLRRIISALVVNARDAMPEGGVTEIFTDSIFLDERNPHFEVPYGHYVRIGVRDEGVGMDEETRRRCFEPFFTTKNVDPVTGIGMSGSGLGLAAAYALAKRNGGRLVAEGRLGKGAVFTLYLPVSGEEAVSLKVVNDNGRKLSSIPTHRDRSIER